jgi:rSAM/selenodomain-associated transferase 1
MRQQRHLAVFLKAPRLGQVKTRLAAGIGALAALGFHRATAAALIRGVARDRRWRVSLWLSPRNALRQRNVPHLGLPRFDQGSGDLGARMALVFRRLPPGPVVLVGTDVPALDAAVIADAFRRLDGSDAVLGPAGDGGYWLVGLRGPRRLRPPFRQVRWSTKHALADTTAQLGRARVALLPPLDDIDTPADFQRWRMRSRSR